MLRGVEISEPILQLVDFKTITDNSGLARVMLHISDGDTMTTLALLSTELTNMVSDGEMDRNCIFRVEKFVRSTSEGK